MPMSYAGWRWPFLPVTRVITKTNGFFMIFFSDKAAGLQVPKFKQLVVDRGIYTVDLLALWGWRSPSFQPFLISKYTLCLTVWHVWPEILVIFGTNIFIVRRLRSWLRVRRRCAVLRVFARITAFCRIKQCTGRLDVEIETDLRWSQRLRWLGTHQLPQGTLFFTLVRLNRLITVCFFNVALVHPWST